MDDFPVVLILYAHDGLKIVDIIRQRLEKTETTTHIQDVSQINKADPFTVLVLFLTPAMLSVLKSPKAPDLNNVYNKMSTCVLIFHETINFTGESVQQFLHQTIPSFQKWHCFPIGEKVLTIVLKILELIDTNEEKLHQDFPDLVPECKLYPECEWKSNQTVFISFDSERTQGDTVTVDVDQTLFEATWVNPYTFIFTYKGCNANGHRLVRVSVNKDYEATFKIFLKDRDQILLEEINDSASPLHFLQEILLSVKDKENDLLPECIESEILNGTKHLLKKLAILPNFSKCNKTDSSNKQDEKTREEEDLSNSTEPVVRRPDSQGIRKRREISIPDCYKQVTDAPCKSTELQSKRLSKAIQTLTAEEELPLIKVNPDLKRTLPADFFDSIQSYS